MPLKVIVISGSLRKQSKNTALANAIVEIGKSLNVDITRYDISSLPIYNEDLEAPDTPNPYPENVTTLRETVRNCDVLVLATPENNFLPSTPMKNVLDWLSRGKLSPLTGKTISIVSAAGMGGGNSAQEALRKSLSKMSWLNMKVIEETVMIKLFDGVKRFDENNVLVDSLTKFDLTNFMTATINSFSK